MAPEISVELEAPAGLLVRRVAGELALEEVLEGGEAVEDVEALVGVGDLFVFEVPGAGMGDVDCAEAGGEGGVDVRLRGVADHPAMVGLPLVGGEGGLVGGDVLFLDDVDAAEVGGETAAVDFGLLFGRVALGEEDEMVAVGEMGEGFGDAVEDVHGVFGEFVADAADASPVLGRDFTFAEFVEALLEVAGEVGGAVAVDRVVGVLDFVEDEAHLGGV